MNTATVASATTRRNASTARYAAESATTVTSDRDPDRPSSASSAARTRDIRKIADSAAERLEGHDHAQQARTAASGRTSSAPSRAGGGAAAAGEEGQQQLALQLEHLAFLVRLRVVEAEQVQDAVRGRAAAAPPRWRARRRGPAWPRRSGRARCRRGRPRRAPASSRPGRSSSIGKLMTSVGPGRSIHCTCEGLHGRLVDEGDAEVGLRVDLQLAHDVAGERDQLGRVGGVLGLVEDLDTHGVPVRGSSRPAAGARPAVRARPPGARGGRRRTGRRRRRCR